MIMEVFEKAESHSFYPDSPLNLMQEQVHNDCIMLITSPCMEARMVGGPVDTSRVTR